jgi:syntaxin 1B/2/3
MPTNTKPLTQRDFLNHIDFTKQQLGELLEYINQISALHNRALNSPDSSSSTRLENIVTQAHTKMGQIRDSIKYLERDGKNDAWKAKHTKQVKIEFQDKIRKYQGVEMNYRQGCRDQIARQYRIVNPEATDDQVRQATEMDWGSEGVFQTVVSPAS